MIIADHIWKGSNPKKPHKWHEVGIDSIEEAVRFAIWLAEAVCPDVFTETTKNGYSKYALVNGVRVVLHWSKGEGLRTCYPLI